MENNIIEMKWLHASCNYKNQENESRDVDTFQQVFISSSFGDCMTVEQNRKHLFVFMTLWNKSSFDTP